VKQEVTADHNLIIKNTNRLFVDAAAHDYHLRKGSKAVNAASPEMAPDIDIEKVPRPWGDGYDIGAYEYHEGEVAPDASDQADPEVRDTREERDETGTDTGRDEHDEPPIAEPPRRVKESPTATETATGESARSIQRDVQSRFGSATSWGVVLLAMSLLYIAWRIGR
jgi:hypothetical protein